MRDRRRVALAGHFVPEHFRRLLSSIPGYGTPDLVDRPAWTDVAGADVVVLYTGEPIEDLRALISPERPGPPILVVAAVRDTGVGIDALRMGATSYVIAGEFTRGQFLSALAGTERGESCVSPAVTSALVRRLHTQQPRLATAAADVSLTERELHLLRLLSEGCSNATIAKRLFLAETTVRNYLSRLYAKLEFCGRSEAIVWWMSHRANGSTELD